MERERPIAPMPMGPPPPRHRDSAAASLMSPPDPTHDSFTQTSHGANLNGKGKGKVSPNGAPLLMSPPISPSTKPIPPTANAPDVPFNQTIKDPVLYPTDESSPPSSSQEPLFPTVEIAQDVDQQLRYRPADASNGAAAPEREGYETAAMTFTPKIMDLFLKDPMGWKKRELAWLKEDRKSRAHGEKKAPTSVQQATKTASVPRPARVQTGRISKPHPTPRRARNSISSGSSGGAFAKSTKRTSSTPEPSRRTAAPNRDDKDFELLADYSPALDTLEDYGHAFKVDWKGTPLDLSNDPHRHLLHRYEVTFASNLRLDCATYLTSKRRVFIRRLECYRISKEFRKTDAQQACKIDVNKASRIWAAYQKAKWLEPKWVERFVQRDH
ncbi:SWIRM domain protein [Cordyceps fumosorosea ARSEF 2679]|uniref:SWIRM domain protein n=1 Tax=Cordyceps fumosorosea (strain ARSEF 2679) TaxID=1081104 RepID=A0A167N5I0_CORFA|nr:SWIRM domain protein [Cordyceps fumosorosea ARSEF 2679]OAA55152.1 SWIRM domain protein [Cordyceps fumosorosea ARSEF 2679]